MVGSRVHQTVLPFVDLPGELFFGSCLNDATCAAVVTGIA